jgi:hypothetical protein
VEDPVVQPLSPRAVPYSKATPSSSGLTQEEKDKTPVMKQPTRATRRAFAIYESFQNSLQQAQGETDAVVVQQEDSRELAAETNLIAQYIANTPDACINRPYYQVLKDAVNAVHPGKRLYKRGYCAQFMNKPNHEGDETQSQTQRSEDSESSFWGGVSNDHENTDSENYKIHEEALKLQNKIRLSELQSKVAFRYVEQLREHYPAPVTHIPVYLLGAYASQEIARTQLKHAGSFVAPYARGIVKAASSIIDHLALRTKNIWMTYRHHIYDMIQPSLSKTIDVKADTVPVPDIKLDFPTFSPTKGDLIRGAIQISAFAAATYATKWFVSKIAPKLKMIHQFTFKHSVECEKVDERPDRLSYHTLKHKDPLYAVVTYEQVDQFGRPYRTTQTQFEDVLINPIVKLDLNVSLELFAQLCTANVKPGATDEEIVQRFELLGRQNQTINISKYRSLQFENVHSDTALLALYWHKVYQRKIGDIPFPNPHLARPYSTDTGQMKSRLTVFSTLKHKVSTE